MSKAEKTNKAADAKLAVSEEEWRKKLTPEQFHVMRQHGTERAFSHPYYNDKRDGMYRCAGCGAPLFSSATKFDSGTGWPSFSEPAVADAIALRTDESNGMHRTEVVCKKCGSHLGHLFDDGPGPTGKRFCINSCSLNMEKKSL